MLQVPTYSSTWLSYMIQARPCLEEEEKKPLKNNIRECYTASFSNITNNLRFRRKLACDVRWSLMDVESRLGQKKGGWPKDSTSCFLVHASFFFYQPLSLSLSLSLSPASLLPIIPISTLTPLTVRPSPIRKQKPHKNSLSAEPKD